MLTEFGLIARYFTRPKRAAQASLGIGDDCALLAPAAGHQLAISTDMLVEGRHFLADVDPHALGHKALAVNLSDLAAMGAAPRAFTLALALPAASESWLSHFSAGLFELADRFHCELIGGDTTAGPLNLCLTIFGDVPLGSALRRDGARPGDDIWISGALGDARLALGALRGEWRVAEDDLPGLRRALERPEPRVALGLALRGIAHAALDLSDGLAGDLQHILDRSGVNAQVDIDAVPRSAALGRQTPLVQRQCTLAGGDDYELCFTAAASARPELEILARELGLRLTPIGKIVAFSAHSDTPSPAIAWHDAAGSPIAIMPRGFDHFYAD